MEKSAKETSPSPLRSRESDAAINSSIMQYSPDFNKDHSMKFLHGFMTETKIETYPRRMTSDGGIRSPGKEEKILIHGYARNGIGCDGTRGKQQGIINRFGNNRIGRIANRLIWETVTKMEA